jgi:23S rRNA (guanosine2251-2'-O)-methyltransferase
MRGFQPPHKGPPPGRRGAGPRKGGNAPLEQWIYGRHAVAAALANPRRRWYRLVALPAQAEAARALVAAAIAVRRGDGEPVQVLERAQLAAMLPPGAVHQGLALAVEPLAPVDLDAIVQAATGAAMLIALDRVSDPQNVGAVLRSAAAFGAAAVILTRDGAPAASGVLAKAASGALEHVPLVRVVNLARALDRLKAAGFWICGLCESASEPLSAFDLGARVVLVLGSEGGGMRRLVRERCDHLARLPTHPLQPTLNVASAAAVALYELARRRC